MICRALLILTGLLPACIAQAAGLDIPATQVVPAGEVVLGADNTDIAAGADEFPQRRVTVTAAFAMGMTQVTRGQFRRFAEATGFAPKGGCWALTSAGWIIDPDRSWRSPGYPQTDAHPVVCISRNDALAYLAWLTDESGMDFRLPTEAEWTLAAGPSALGRSSQDICTFGNVNDLTSKNKVAKVAEHCDDGFLFTSPAGHFLPNEFGLFDMTGNVWEWTADCHGGGFANLPKDGSPQAERDCAAYALRGHSWTDPPGPVRLGTRYALPGGARQSIVGFRVARGAADD
ncbi:MAG: formylglycine-generating enzyme family protein [Candidatus Phaeomarinobacter sp.]